MESITKLIDLKIYSNISNTILKYDRDCTIKNESIYTYLHTVYVCATIYHNIKQVSQLSL